MLCEVELLCERCNQSVPIVHPNSEGYFLCDECFIASPYYPYNLRLDLTGSDWIPNPEIFPPEPRP